MTPETVLMGGRIRSLDHVNGGVELPVRGVRGAVCAAENTRDDILTATRKLLLEMVRVNDFDMEDVASILFTVTVDLNADFPASAARELGWVDVPLLCATEIDVPGKLNRTVRVLMHVNTDKGQREINHVYLGDAVQLRPDLKE